MELWDRDAIDLIGPAHPQIGTDGSGTLRFIAVEGDVDGRHVERERAPRGRGQGRESTSVTRCRSRIGSSRVRRNPARANLHPWRRRFGVPRAPRSYVPITPTAVADDPSSTRRWPAPPRHAPRVTGAAEQVPSETVWRGRSGAGRSASGRSSSPSCAIVGSSGEPASSTTLASLVEQTLTPSPGPPPPGIRKQSMCEDLAGSGVGNHSVSQLLELEQGGPR
jgi:hypothetical protein